MGEHHVPGQTTRNPFRNTVVFCARCAVHTNHAPHCGRGWFSGARRSVTSVASADTTDWFFDIKKLMCKRLQRG